MIDVKVLRENPDLVRASQKARGEDASLVDKALAADELRRSAIVEFEALRAEQNALSKSVGAAKGDEKAALLEKAKSLSNSVKEAEVKKNFTETEFKKVAMEISNLVDTAAPIGGEADFKVIEEIGTPRTFDFEPKDHVELGKILGAIDTERDFYLVGTSEVPLAAYHMDEILDGKSLPLRYAGYSPCFRREAGSYGKDTRGIIRVHQFEKVEMFSFCAPEDAAAEHKRLLAWEKDFLNAMEIPYRVIDVATGDLGSSANRKFDCEAWVPTQNAYREVTSTSNCSEFQARRLNVRTRGEDGTSPVATLNGTLVAIPRMIVSILENHQQADGSVLVPKALQPYLGMDRFLPVG